MIERWAFSDAELKNPQACNGFDELVADEIIGYNKQENRLIYGEIGVLVQRNGTVTNRYADGTIGVANDVAELAGEDESPCHTDGTPCDNWRDVETNDKGEFIRFANE